ncbi:uncharacterized protein LOC129920506 [Episyrphus balteatus]|uniref:uncharacterized protein LOC129920506 n=1 Tax=Episyrphus balteatus TaxID=286459 RepID=UPI0024862EFE|nr:uncharacterized protein LOC129920506 [Episyrphus balteatus]
MNAESSKSEQHDHEISQHKSFPPRHCQQIDNNSSTNTNFNDQQQKDQEHIAISDQQANSETSSIDSFTTTTHKNSTNSGRNKRKNFNPRPTTALDIDSTTTIMDSSLTTSVLVGSGGNNISESSSTKATSSSTSNIHHHSFAPSSVAVADRGFFSAQSLDKNAAVSQLTQYYPWLQMFNHYEQLVKAVGLKTNQHHQHFQQASGNDGREVGPEMSEWVGKYGSRNSSSEAASAIRDILKAYQGIPHWNALHHQHQDGGHSVNLSTETEPPTPPTTPQTTCHSSLRPTILANGSTGPSSPYHHHSPDRSKIKEEFKNALSTPSSPQPNLDRKRNCSESNLNWNKEDSEQQTSSNKDYEETDDVKYHEQLPITQHCHDEGSKDAAEKSRQQQNQNIYQWCEDLQQIDNNKVIKSECDDTETIVDDCGDSCYVENNIYDEEDYPPHSPNDFPDSTNDDDEEDDDDDEDDDNYSLNMFCDDDQSEAERHRQQNHFQVGVNCSSDSDHQRNAIPTTPVDIGDPDDNTNLTNVEKDSSTCSNSSSRISVRNLGGFYEEQGQVNLNPLPKPLHGSDEKTMHPDFVQNMNKFTSHLDCLNEMCRLENLREHYHCHDYPCFGKVLSKKEEVIRHVKWHRKRMESLNHGFMRFSSSDDCSATFGVNCQHNRKQTHYHCFQPNCDRVYISTSDVQMHSNFHRKDSAIHKEGFQRFRANETCNAEYCMFSGQKTTHFHCRRDNCRYTFKNKADMEKHKTYHIKDLKLARDGFKKFLKNEACPYKQCKFSKVCNHIHCARKNCFYVLHSSGQLLSHKRKHERIDNEQTYCRYKMLAVKAALMGNSSVTAASSATTDSTETPAFNFSKSLMQLNDHELLSSFNPASRSSLEVPSLLPKPERTFHQNADNEVPPEASPSSIMSMEFLQQMEKRHEEILNQKIHRKTEVSNKISSDTQAIKKSNSPNQYNTVHESNLLHLTPSVIQQFFTSECPSLRKKKLQEKDDHPTEDLNLDCPWQEHPESHLHCVLKDCGAVTPNNIADISAHIRMHGYNREMYATPNAASPNPLTASSSNPMQITTIDGFFNRKRGRPPKNRFVEVYKNAQQSPQAIFTSFKLEKQTSSKESPDAAHQQLCIDTSTSSIIDLQQKHKDESVVLNQSSSVALFAPRNINSQFVIYNQNESCSVASGAQLCSLAMQQHYHCTCLPDCTFVTKERDLLSVHLERQHTAISFADTISKKFKRFDRNIGLDCGIFECKLRRTRPHLHCRQCFRQISPFDLESHVCESTDERPSLSNSPTKKLLPSSIGGSPTKYISRNEQQDPSSPSPSPVGNKNSARDYSHLPSVTFSTLNELRRKVSEMEPEGMNSSAGPKRNHEDEKVLVVRAAGTYFPENTSDLSNTPSPAQQHRQTTAGTSESLQSPPAAIPSNSAYCSTPYCKQKRRPHDHCDTCDQAFVDPIKWRAHRLKHLQATNQPIPFHMSHFIEPEESIPPSYPKLPISYDDQPQDLSVSPNTTTLDERLKFSKESFPGSPPATIPPLLSQTSSAAGNFLNYFPQNLMSSLSLQNFHLTQLATLYQQNPYYYQHLHPFLSNTMNPASRYQQQNRPTAQPYRIPGSKDKSESHNQTSTESLSCQPASVIPALHPSSSNHFPFLNPLLMVQSPFERSQSKPPTISTGGPSPSTFETAAAKSQKRKLSNGNEEFSTLIDVLSPSTKKQVQFAAGLAAAAAAAAVAANNTSPINQRGGSPSSAAVAASTRTTLDHQQHGHGQHFKIRDEQIPNGYLKFRFNEDCFFPKCGYRNHQSHFHCDRNDCHYSFCDKTRFVQHTARHERLDKLMGNDFRQYRANMSCGYENCPYYKNLGSANKSSHFHCLKCDFICSDTNKVVAHRRQHNKMEYIRMAGFRKVTNSEKCNSTFEATIPTNGNELPGTVECSYSQKQTHYHCLVCDVSVLSRAQLGSHKHKT